MNALVQENVEKLTAKRTADGCSALKELLTVSKCSDVCYPYMEHFLELLDSDNSYVRTRGLLLIVENARWDTENKIDEQLDHILLHIVDEKPITARQFIQSLPTLALAKPDLRQIVLERLKSAHTWVYPSSMRPLVEKDIRQAVLEIQSMSIPPRDQSEQM